MTAKKNDESNEPIKGIRVKSNGDVAVVALYLSKTAVSETVKAEQFKEYLIKTLEGGINKIIIDLSRCDFIDSTFLGVLITSLKNYISTRNNIKLTLNFCQSSSVLTLNKIEKGFEKFIDLNSTFDGINDN